MLSVLQRQACTPQVSLFCDLYPGLVPKRQRFGEKSGLLQCVGRCTAGQAAQLFLAGQKYCLSIFYQMQLALNCRNADRDLRALS